jgi:hypothetical protein
MNNEKFSFKLQNPTIHFFLRNFALRLSTYTCAKLKYTYRVFTEYTNQCDVGKNYSNTKKLEFNLLPERHYLSDTKTPRMTAQKLVNNLFSVLYLCNSDARLYRPKSVVEMAAIAIVMIRTSRSSTECILKMLLHLEYLTEHGTYQRKLITKCVLVQ